jgi:PhnB protein
MAEINCYLTFNGNCREAMTFYQDCLGGELYFQTLGESPLSEKMPKKMKDCILHATLIKSAMVMQGSDMAPQSGLVKGNNVSLLLNCNSKKEIRTIYSKLSAGGRADHVIEYSFWGALFGKLTDKFGNHWLLSFDKNKK